MAVSRPEAVKTTKPEGDTQAESPNLKGFPTQQPRMTPEAQAALAAPLDPKFIKERKGDNGKMYSYADLDYLEARASEVDPDWSNHFASSSPNVITCDTTILGVSHGATAGYYIGDTYEVWDFANRKMLEKPMTSRVAHTTVTAAQAAAERRSFAMFGLGAELWKKDPESQADAPSGSGGHPSSASRPPSVHSGPKDFREPSAARINLLSDLGVPETVAKLINSWSVGKDAKGQPVSDVSKTINALFEARGRDKGPVSRKTWESVVSEHAPYALGSATTGDTDDEDDEWAS